MRTAATARLRSANTRRYGEIWGDMGRYGEIYRGDGAVAQRVDRVGSERPAACRVGLGVGVGVGVGVGLGLG